MSIARKLMASSGGEVIPFEYTIQTTSSNKKYKLPLTAPAGNQPSFTVEWGDGSSSEITDYLDVDIEHTYTSADTYTISISGVCPGFKVNNNPNYRSLYKSVINWGTVQFIEIDFYGCENLDNIPNDGSGNAINHEGLRTVRRFNNTFNSSGLTSIPNGLFDFAFNVSSYVNTFNFLTGLSSIPSGLFDTSTEVTSFAGCFQNCISLDSIPTNLFDNNTKVQNFQSVFRNCRDIVEIPDNLFTYNQSVTTFRNSFNMATTNNSLTGNTPTDLGSGNEIWERTPEPLGIDCFAFCTGLNNFASIPNDFK